MSHVFISYQQANADFAALTMMQLEKAGFDTWLDKNRLRPGNDWSQEIDRGVIEAMVLIVIMSPEAKASEYVTYEWSFALGANVPVLPIMLDETKLHPRLERLQYLNFMDGRRPWETLTDELAEIQKKGNSLLRLPKDTPPYIRHAIMALDSANKADREGAVETLSESSHTVAQEALEGALNHDLRDVRFAAAIALAQRGERRAVATLFESIPQDFEDEDFKDDYREEELYQRIENALFCINTSEQDAIIEILMGKIRKSENLDTKLVEIAVRSFEYTSNEKALPILIELTKRTERIANRYVFDAAVDAISHIAIREKSAALSALTDIWQRLITNPPYELFMFHTYTKNLHHTSQTLLELDAGIAVPLFRSALKNEFYLVKVVATVNLSDEDSEETVSAIKELLNDAGKHEIYSVFQLFYNYLPTRQDEFALSDIAFKVLRRIGTPSAIAAIDGYEEIVPENLSSKDLATRRPL